MISAIFEAPKDDFFTFNLPENFIVHVPDPVIDLSCVPLPE
jgi:hypothetical protein